MSASTDLLNTLNGAAGGDAQFELLWAAISVKVKIDLAQVRVMGSGEVIVHNGGDNQSTLITTHD